LEKQQQINVFLKIGQPASQARAAGGPDWAARKKILLTGLARAVKIFKIMGPDNRPGSTFFSFTGRAGAGRYFPRITMLYFVL
jgi:hypothetical protein